MKEPCNYLVQPQMQMTRCENEDIQNAIVAKWRCSETRFSLHGNINQSLRFDTTTNEFLLFEGGFGSRDLRRFDDNIVFSFQVISSALMLYRCVSLGFMPHFDAEHQYKTIWASSLIHVATGEKLVIQDFKAGFDINTHYTDADDMPAAFRADTLKLLNHLVSDQITHPYDGTIAGAIA